MLFPNHTLTLIMCLHLTWCCKNVQFSQTPLLLVRIILMGWDHDIFMVSVIKDSQLIMYSAIMKKVFLPNIMYCTVCSRGKRSYMCIFNHTFFKFRTKMKIVCKYFLNFNYSFWVYTGSELYLKTLEGSCLLCYCHEWIHKYSNPSQLQLCRN